MTKPKRYNRKDSFVILPHATEFEAAHKIHKIEERTPLTNTRFCDFEPLQMWRYFFGTIV